MSRNIIIAIIVIVIVIVIGLVYYFSQEKITPLPGEGIEPTEIPENKLGLQEYMLEAYPDYLEGTISFSDDTATLKTDGKVYILQPKDPKFYQDQGIEEGQEVAIQGKIVMDEYLTVGVIK